MGVVWGVVAPLLNDTWFFTPGAGWFPCDNADANHPCTSGGTSSPPSKRCCVGLTFGDNLGGTPDGHRALDESLAAQRRDLFADQSEGGSQTRSIPTVS